MTDTFLTITAPAEGDYMEKGSKFLAYAFPVRNEEEVAARLQALKKLHPKARHYCSALRLNPDASLERSSDDGEPSGSAGRPILGQLIKHQLTNILVVVVRYFGGTKLGIPGLIEAYKWSTAAAIANARTVQQKVYQKFRISMSFDFYPNLLNYLKQHDFPVFDEKFEHQAMITFGLRQSEANELLLHVLRDLSQRDYQEIKDYCQYLGITLELLDEVEII